MAQGAITSQKVATPTLEQFKAVKHSTVIVGTSVIQVPAASTDGRKGLILQNKHDSNTIYIGGGIPDIIIASQKANWYGNLYSSNQWVKAAASDNEWYFATSTNTTTGISQPRYVFYKAHGGSETLATIGTVGSLAAQHGIGWGTETNISGNTLYIRTDGATPAENPKDDYEYILSYTFQLTADDTTVTGGMEIRPLGDLPITLDGSGKLFAIASGATTALGILEVF